MSRARKVGEVVTTQQEIFFQSINDIVSQCEKDGIIPTPALFINVKYTEARHILNKILKILPAIALKLKEEKMAHEQEWKASFKSQDEELSELEQQKKKAIKLVSELDSEFRKTKVELEEAKKKVREDKEKLTGDEQRKATLVMKKRTEMIADLEAEQIELDHKEDAISNKAGCCGLSKKKKAELANIQYLLRTVHNKIEGIKAKKDDEIDVYDEEFAALEKAYLAASKKLSDFVEKFPKNIKEAKDKLDMLEVDYNEKENHYQVIKSRFITYLSNELMFGFLQLYVYFNDFYAAVQKIESTSSKLAAFKDALISVKSQMDESLSIFWCPNSKDRSGTKLLASLLQDPAKKMLLIETENLSPAIIQKIVPTESGRILNRLKKGDLTGVEVRIADVISLPEIKENKDGSSQKYKQ